MRKMTQTFLRWRKDGVGYENPWIPQAWDIKDYIRGYTVTKLNCKKYSLTSYNYMLIWFLAVTPVDIFSCFWCNNKEIKYKQIGR